AVVSGSPAVIVADLDGNPLQSVSRPEQVGRCFPPLPFAVDARGNLRLGGLCAPPRAQGVFGGGGEPLPDPPADPAPSFQTSGTFWSEPLDSGIYRCQWHRVVLNGDIPRKTAVLVSTFTSEAPQTFDQIQALPEDVWETNLFFAQTLGPVD